MKQYKLNVDPRILELLGPNLYTNIYYVLAELIANAYDADAKNVYILSNKDDIRVEDDGHGMSYEKGDIDKYLNVAAASRSEEADSFSKSGERRKMGRKGVGKLAALSVSEDVDIFTVADGEKSGFVLSRHPEEGSKLKAIAEDEIIFERITSHGSAIVMRHPQYRLHKTLASVKRNLLKIFPLVSSDFRIHIVRGDKVEIIDDFDRNVMQDLGALITLGNEFKSLTELVPDLYPQKREELVTAQDEKAIPLTMKDNEGVECEYTLKVEGWIGTYKTTRGRKAEMSEFPDNFISLFANKKMGEFNILPAIGQNKLGEVYVVGQLHIDIFELSELPDMALSNRQGYKSDDPRYQHALEYIRRELLPDILKRREKFTDLVRGDKKKKKQEVQVKNEEKFRESVDRFRSRASKQAAINLLALGKSPTRDAMEAAISDSINKSSPELGLKTLIDSQKKKILISHTWNDKSLADIVYQMLLYNNVPSEEILYTNCDDEVCRVPEGFSVYDYLRDFFVESYSSQKIYVLFVTSENTRRSWGAVSEVGASWITKVDHKIFNIPPFRPEQPLNNSHVWQTTNRESPTEGDLWMLPLNADVFCQKIEDACDSLGYEAKGREDNRRYLGTLVSIRAD
ncbi:ATP-binding protein [Halomonas elongata]|uniref:ATP-binding protein n=1 Tax=Halomonas elongata TaxID=2746 RepID=UPI00255A7F53|nr:ATP-binding protein [Halomonas elongata]MDL4863658.1 ATP-binding protein [Halomonas elongata]